MRYSYKKALDVLTEYSYSEGYVEVSLNHDNISIINWKLRSINEPKKISIQSGHTAEVQVYLFLHELGHHELRKDWDHFSELFPIVAKAENHKSRSYERKYRRRHEYFVDSLAEEYTAWDEGLVLAESLGIPIRVERWNRLRTKCLLGYIRYYGNLKR